MEARQLDSRLVTDAWLNSIPDLQHLVEEQVINQGMNPPPDTLRLEMSPAEWAIFDQFMTVLNNHPNLVVREFVIDGSYGPTDWCAIEIGLDVGIHNYEMDNQGLAIDDPSRSRNLSMIRNLRRIFWAFENSAFHQEGFHTSKFTVALMPEQWKLYDEVMNR